MLASEVIRENGDRKQVTEIQLVVLLYQQEEDQKSEEYCETYLIGQYEHKMMHGSENYKPVQITVSE